jgi:hypothetical protein
MDTELTPKASGAPRFKNTTRGNCSIHHTYCREGEECRKGRVLNLMHLTSDESMSKTSDMPVSSKQ